MRLLRSPKVNFKFDDEAKIPFDAQAQQVCIHIL